MKSVIVFMFLLIVCQIGCRVHNPKKKLYNLAKVWVSDSLSLSGASLADYEQSNLFVFEDSVNVFTTRLMRIDPSGKEWNSSAYAVVIDGKERNTYFVVYKDNADYHNMDKDSIERKRIIGRYARWEHENRLQGKN